MSPAYRSPINRDVALASKGEFTPLDYGAFRIWPPVVLAPMAGITNAPFRMICREMGAGLFISEMITARGIVERNAKTLLLARFATTETPRSIQLYGTDPSSLAEATRFLVGEGRVDHIDLNFGCPVRKVMSQGGGAAIPYRPRLLARLVRAVVEAAGGIPVTIKVRKGIDGEHLTFLTSGEVARDEGCVAIGLHARTAAQLYDGAADWKAIAALVAHVSDLKVLGNGDIWEPWDALRMMRQTGCNGVVVGRGCLGRPWLFHDLAMVFTGREPAAPPALGDVVRIMKDHARRLTGFMGETMGVRHMRKWSQWYTKGFPGSARYRHRLIQVRTLVDLDRILDELDPAMPFPLDVIRTSRAKHSGTQKPSLPPGYLDDPSRDTCPRREGLAANGG